MTNQERHWILGGGLASGKSVVRALLRDAGVATIDADAIGHEVIGKGGPAYDAVASRWAGVVVEDEIDRQALAEIVFGDPAELEILESITHPHIFGMIQARVEELEAPVVVEIPLLRRVPGGDWGRLIVDSRREAKLARAVERGMSDADARARLDAQPSRAQWLAAADLVIPNHGTLGDLRAVVDAVLPWL